MMPMIKYHAIGLPYHGEIVGSQLTLPNAATMTTAAQDDGAVYVVKNPVAPGITRTTEEQTADTAAGKSWRTYGLVTSAKRFIAGKSLGYNRWIYCDGNGRSWVIKAECVVLSSSSYKVVITLESAFGRFSEKNTYSSINRVLFESTLDYTSLDIADTAYISTSVTNELGIDQNEDGSEAVFNIYTQEASAVGGTYEKFKYKDTDTALLAYFDITISGNGSVDPAYLGNGISGIVSFGQSRADFSTIDTVTNSESTSMPTGDLLASGCSAAPDTEYGTFLGDEPGPGGECYTYIKQFSLVHSFDYSYTGDARTVVTYDTKMRRVFNGNSAGWLKFVAVTESGSYLTVSTSGQATKWIQTNMSWDEVNQTCSVDSVDSGFDQTARSGTAVRQSHNDVSITVSGLSGSISGEKLNRTGLNYSTILNHDPPFTSNPGGVCYGIGGEWQTDTAFDTVSGEEMTVELLNGRVGNLKTASQVINCISVEGGTYGNTTFENVSYQPEINQWNTDPSAITSWA